MRTLPAGGSPTYIFQEDFETGQGAWSGTADYAYATSPAPLQGSFSLRLQNQSVYNQDAFDLAEAWAYFLWNPVNFVSTHEIFALWNSSLVAVLTISGNTGTGVLTVASGTSTASTVATWSEGTTYQVWAHYLKGSGANAVAEVFFVATVGASKPAPASNNHASLSNGTATTNATTPNFNTNFALTDMVFDKLRIDDVDIGSNPT